MYLAHQALSKVYANDVNGATQSQIEHVGLVRFINKIKGLTIPNRSAVKIRAMDKSGDGHCKSTKYQYDPLQRANAFV